MLKIGALDPKWLLLAGGVVVALWWANRQATSVGNAASSLLDRLSSAAGTAVDAINPASPTNVVYQGANSLAGTDSLGGSLFDWLHPNATGLAPAAPVTSSSSSYVPSVDTPLGPSVDPFGTGGYGF